MCTPPRSTTRMQAPTARIAEPGAGSRGSRTRPASCRWIDDEGHEWLFTRDGGTLLVQRPTRTESVMIRFPDLPSEGTGGSPGEAWVLFCTADGHLFHCSVCQEVRMVEFPKSERSATDIGSLNAHVRTFLEPEDCGWWGARDTNAEIGGEGGR